MGCFAESPLVSVIVPVYNVENYLGRCLDSIVGQTYQNLEIILVDDGSTDRSGEICRRYAAMDPRIQLVVQENRGPSAARNTGLDCMTGEYVTFVDSDDYISRYFIEILFSKLQEFKVEIVTCDYIVTAEENDNALPDLFSEGDSVFCEQISGEAALNPINQNFESVAMKLFEKRIFQSIRFKEGKLSEDILISRRIYVQVNRVCHVRRKLYAYRQRENSLSRKDRIPVASADYLEALLDRLIFFREQNIEQYIPITCRRILESYTFLSEYPQRKEMRKDMQELEERLYHITGKRYFLLKYSLFKAFPGLYQLLRKGYKKIQFMLLSNLKTESS